MKNIWFDCDIAVGQLGCDPDDGYALAYLLKQPDKLNVLGVSTIFGNTNKQNHSLKQIGIIQKLLGVNIPTYAGAEYKEDRANTQALVALAKTLQTERLTYVSAGPSTNLHQCLLRYPELASQIDEVILLGGRINGAQASLGPAEKKFPDQNFYWDFVAFEFILKQKMNLTFLTVESLQNQFWNSEDLEILAGGGVVSRYLAKQTRIWNYIWKILFKAEGFVPWDIYLVDYFINTQDYEVIENLEFKLDKVRNNSSFPMNIMWPAKFLNVLNLFQAQSSNVKTHNMKAIKSIKQNQKNKLIKVLAAN